MMKPDEADELAGRLGVLRFDSLAGGAVIRIGIEVGTDAVVDGLHRGMVGLFGKSRLAEGLA